jgi:Cu+-exporting ATPase
MDNPEQTNREKLTDPVCRMEVSPDSPLRTVYQDREYFFCSERCLAEFNKDPQYYAGKVARVEKVEDPVCGMPVQTDSPYRLTYDGRDFVFCSPRCQELFQSHPERFLKPGMEEPEKAEVPAVSKDEETPEPYLTCPMHPEVKEPVPRCPKCPLFDLDKTAAWEVSCHWGRTFSLF